MNRRQLSRRQFIGAAAATGAGLALSGGAGRLIEQATAATSRCATLSDIEHVVILIQENRSFDHYFGVYPAVAGFSDPAVINNRNGKPIWYQYGWGPGDKAATPGDYLLPFHLDTAHTNAECTNNNNHDWVPQHLCWDGGAMDRFVSTHLAVDGLAAGPMTMGYYTRSDLGFYYALADAFTVCDHYYSSVLGPTDPNRLYSFSATIDPDGRAGGPVIANPRTGIPLAGSAGGSPSFSWETMPEALQQAGVSWKVYQPPGSQVVDAVIDTVLFYFPKYRDPSSPYFQRGILPSFPGDFQTDVAQGTLPQVSWIVPTQVIDEHPSSPPPLGELVVTRQVLATLVSNPKIWESTVLLVTYDENGGFFDHVPPPTPPLGTTGEYLTTRPAIGTNIAPGGAALTGPIGLGFRVPTLVISPFSTGGLICSDTFDHTSTLRFLETRFGAIVPNLSTWRRQHTGDLTSALNFAAGANSNPTSVPGLLSSAPAIAQDVIRIATQCPVDGPLGAVDLAPAYPIPTRQMVPSQEPGTRGKPSGIMPC